MSILKKFSLTLLALAVMVGALGFSTQPAAAGAEALTCSQYHTVQRGEYLVMIARMYDTDWRTLAEINDLSNPSRIYPGQKLCVSTDGVVKPTPTTPAPKPNTGSAAGSVFAVSVVEDETVSLEAINLPANTRFTVRLGRMGSKGVNGVKIGTMTSNSGGVASGTFDIPSSMWDRQQVAVRIESAAGHYAYNWFYNEDGEGEDLGGSINNLPSFSVQRVVEDKSVTIRTKNLPAHTTFVVYMDRAGNLGEDGYRITSFESGSGGRLRLTFNMPRQLRDRANITLRLEDPDTGLFIVNTFTNEDSD